MAAEAAIVKMRRFLMLSRRERKKTQKNIIEDLHEAQIRSLSMGHSAPINFNKERNQKGNPFF
jgi:hypothetical protein